MFNTFEAAVSADFSIDPSWDGMDVVIGCNLRRNSISELHVMVAF